MNFFLLSGPAPFFEQCLHFFPNINTNIIVKGWPTGGNNDCSRFEEIPEKNQWCVTGNFEDIEEDFSPDKAIDSRVSNETTGYFESCADETYLEVKNQIGRIL